MTQINEVKKITTPLDDNQIKQLQPGDSVLITGYIYTARDAAHKRLIELLKNKQELPFDLINRTNYLLCWPSPG